MSNTIINEACVGNNTKNTGGSKKQCLAGAVKTYFLAKENFSFASLSAMKDKANWDEAKKNKDIVPFFEIEVIEANNTESTIANKRFGDKKTKQGIKGVTYTHELSPASHAALASYDGTAEYSRIFRATTENEGLCETMEDGTIKGEPISSFIVDIRNDATDESDATTKVMIKFKDYDMSIVKPDFDLNEYEGIYDLELAIVEATATSIKFSAKSFGANVTNLATANVVLKDATGSVHAATFVPFDTDDEVYELTGTGFANDFTLDIDGVQEVGTVMYESTGKVTLEGIS